MSYQHEQQIAVEAVLQAAQLCIAVRQGMVRGLEKKDRSPVTVADFGAQALVCHHLKQAFPADPIVGEEDSTALKTDEARPMLDKVVAYVQHTHPDADSETVCQWIDDGNGVVSDRYWTLDPIDGTKGFLRNDQYAIALALVEQGEIKVAALACPALPADFDDPQAETGVVLTAIRDQGAQMATILPDPQPTSFQPIRVSEDKFRFVESVESSHGDHSLQQAIAQAVGITASSLRMDSQAKYAAVARGDAVLYLRLPSPKSPNYREKIWDHAAGTLIVEEAGGRVTDMHGQSLDFASDYKMNNNRGVVVSSGRIHEAVLGALSSKSLN